jgi:hypothetical protein
VVTSGIHSEPKRLQFAGDTLLAESERWIEVECGGISHFTIVGFAAAAGLLIQGQDEVKSWNHVPGLNIPSFSTEIGSECQTPNEELIYESKLKGRVN